MSERTRPKLRAILLSATVILAASVVALLSIPTLFAPQRVAASDVIVHLSSDARLQGDEYVAQLYREGLSRQVVCASSQVSWELYPADASRTHLVSLGVPEEAISVLHLPITECGAQALPFLIDALTSNGAKSALLVVDPTVTRFSEWRTRRRLAASGIVATTTFASEDRKLMLDQWWRSHWKAQRIVGAIMNSTLDLLYAPCR